MFKIKILTVLTALLTVVSAHSRNLKVVYIAHDVETPVSRLMDKIEAYHDEIGADEDDAGNRTILYMSSGSNPIIADMRSGDTDESNYERIMREFERNYHDVNGEYDAQRIIELFDKVDFCSPSGELTVQDFTFEFYVTPEFWQANNNEKLISALFFSLGLDRYADPKHPMYTNDMSYTVHFPNMDNVRAAKGQDTRPFGVHNVNNINGLIGTQGIIGTYE